MPPPEAGTQALRSAAASGDARAQFIVAGRYLDGQGVAQDFAKALFWYQQAAAAVLPRRSIVSPRSTNLARAPPPTPPRR